MVSKKTQRKLTAILCADVVGYSRLMGDDEEATIETLTACRSGWSRTNEPNGLVFGFEPEKMRHPMPVFPGYGASRLPSFPPK